MSNGASSGSSPAPEPKCKIDIVSEGDQFTIKPLNLEAKPEDMVRWRAKGAEAKIKFPNKELFDTLELNLEKGEYKDLQIQKKARKEIKHNYDAYMGDRTLNTGGVDPDIIIR